MARSAPRAEASPRRLQDRARRFRHRLFVAELPAHLPGRQDQARPLVHRHRRARPERRHHPRRGDPRPRDEPRGRRRRHFLRRGRADRARGRAATRSRATSTRRRCRRTSSKPISPATPPCPTRPDRAVPSARQQVAERRDHRRVVGGGQRPEDKAAAERDPAGVAARQPTSLTARRRTARTRSAPAIAARARRSAAPSCGPGRSTRQREHQDTAGDDQVAGAARERDVDQGPEHEAPVHRMARDREHAARWRDPSDTRRAGPGCGSASRPAGCWRKA